MDKFNSLSFRLSVHVFLAKRSSFAFQSTWRNSWKRGRPVWKRVALSRVQTGFDIFKGNTYWHDASRKHTTSENIKTRMYWQLNGPHVGRTMLRLTANIRENIDSYIFDHLHPKVMKLRSLKSCNHHTVWELEKNVSCWFFCFVPFYMNWFYFQNT